MNNVKQYFYLHISSFSPSICQTGS